jgi:hypothetical protein
MNQDGRERLEGDGVDDTPGKRSYGIGFRCAK